MGGAISTTRLASIRQPAKRRSVRVRSPFLVWPLAVLVVLGIGGAVYAQIEAGDRGVAPIDNSGSFEVGGVEVDVTGKNADAARLGGWREAQRKGWKMLFARMHGGAVAPTLSDSTLDSMVAGIVVEHEQVSPRRYIATLGVLFDRARTGQILGVHGQVMRSPPMLVIPVQWSGSVATSFEQRTEWQRAWARFRSGGSPIDYVRPPGTASDPLLLNVAQARRPGRSWWRLLLDQFGSADILVPEVRIGRAWPGGPATADFVARHGPDGFVIAKFSLRAADSAGIPRMLDEGVRRIDEEYTRALGDGRLTPDPSLVLEEEEPEETDETAIEDIGMLLDELAATTATFSVQVQTPDATSVSQVEQALRSVPGVRAASVTSLALGGLSDFRVNFAGDIVILRGALASRGWQVEEAGGSLRLRMQRPPAAAPTPAAPPVATPEAATPAAPAPGQPSR